MDIQDGSESAFLGKARTLRNVLGYNLCYWPCFIDQGTETGRNVSHTPKGALHQLLSRGSGAQDSADSDQVICSGLLLHASRQESCFSSQGGRTEVHTGSRFPKTTQRGDDTARKEPGCICLHGASHPCLCANSWSAHSRHLIKTETARNPCCRGSWLLGTGPLGAAVLLGVSKSSPPPDGPGQPPLLGQRKLGEGGPGRSGPEPTHCRPRVRLLRGLSLREGRH